MNNFININTISELHKLFSYKSPSHPLISVIDLSQIEIKGELLHKKIGTSFYNITFKTKTTHMFKYGRNYFDFSDGILFGIAPNQVFEVDESSEKGEMEGWALYFHPDLIRGYSLMDKISDYGFFSYDTNEALHISNKEKDTLNDTVHKIVDEYESKIDEFSQDVIVSNVELLFNYIKRFYSRQFITRRIQNQGIVSRFNQLLKEYFSSDLIKENGLPTVSHFAKSLNISDSYLSDLLRKETGTNTQENIHLYVINRSKDILINTNKSISEIAYELGFEYPQYFSRLFKKKTGETPREYRENDILSPSSAD